MKRKQLLLCALVAIFMLFANSAWAGSAYVKLTAENGTVSWIEIKGIINGTSIEIKKNNEESAIDKNTEGSIDLSEIWSESDRGGTRYKVNIIGQSAFSDCSGLTSVVIPSGVTSIYERAFFGCSGLTSIEIPSSVKYVHHNSFCGCSGLISIVVAPNNPVYDSRENCNAIIETSADILVAGCKNTKIPSSVRNIGQYAFYGCESLTSIVIPDGVASIGEYAFYSCENLTSVDIPSSVRNIYQEAFSWCESLTSLKIPEGVISIGASAFYGCESLTSLVIPTSVRSIGRYSFALCSGLTSLEISSGVTSIGDYAFEDCSGLTSVVIPSSVTSFGECAFSTCSGLISVEISSGVTSIGDYAFQGCFRLTSIVIPSSVTYIGWNAFRDCYGLTSIFSYITEVFETQPGAFSECENATLYVPHGLEGTYQSIPDWNSISKIEEMPETVPLAISCNNKGKVMINGGVQFTNNVGEISVYNGMDYTFSFQPNDNCELRQVLIDGIDLTHSVKNNQLTTTMQKDLKVIVMFDKSSGDMNDDGAVDISDVVALVNMILGQ